MIYVFFVILAVPTCALLWAIVRVAFHRRRVLRHGAFSILGALMMFPVVILYIGLMEIGVRWLTSLPGMVFGTVFLIGVSLFTWAEVHKAKDRRIPRWGCPTCGYDRRGIDGPCPECGGTHLPDRPA